jgi:nucleotide-binding universal stress UspA family protein
VLAAARTYEADLIVIGAHAQGNTAERIVEQAIVPVFVVRPTSIARTRASAEAARARQRDL